MPKRVNKSPDKPAKLKISTKGQIPAEDRRALANLLKDFRKAERKDS